MKALKICYKLGKKAYVNFIRFIERQTAIYDF